MAKDKYFKLLNTVGMIDTEPGTLSGENKLKALDLIQELGDEYKQDQACVREYIEEIEQLKADLRGKDNDIQVLKWRLEYRKQFMPKEVLEKAKESNDE